MAEFMAMAGGLAAVLQLSASAQRLVKVLYRLAADAGAASDEVNRFATQVETFSNTIKVAQFGLRQYCTEHTNYPVVIYISELRVLDGVNSEAKHVQQHLQAIARQVKALRSRSVLWTRFKWLWNKSSILDLHPGLESVKTSLNLLLATTQLEAATIGGGLEKEM